MAHRYFVSEISGSTAVLEGPEAKHLGKVLRAQVGQTVTLCNGAGTDWDGKITSIQPERVEFVLSNQRPTTVEPATRVTLFVGYPKQDKLEQIIQKGVELGAAHFVPFFSRFCVAAPKKEEQKNLRYNRISSEAAKQCGRGVLPDVAAPLDIGQLPIAMRDFDAVLFCYECGGQSLRRIAPALSGKKVALITGAEGGFSPEEANMLLEAGATPIGLGQRILRCETAPIAALSALMALCGELE